MSSPLILINHWSSIPWATSSTIWAIIYPCHQTFINDFLSIHENYSHYILFYPSNTSSILVVKYAMILHWLILYSQFTTPRHYIPNHQIGWENGFHRQKVGREWVLPTDLVGHRKSSRENPLPTDITFPTDCLMAIEKLSRPTYSLPTDVSFPTDVLSWQTVGRCFFLPTNFPLAIPCTFPDQPSDTVFFADQHTDWGVIAD